SDNDPCDATAVCASVQAQRRTQRTLQDGTWQPHPTGCFKQRHPARIDALKTKTVDAHHSRAGSIKATVVGLVDSSCILGPHRQHGCPCKTHQA
ncbi:hypothetical protein BC831DRAFT_552712, partial [Entophlyctis helioformis]